MFYNRDEFGFDSEVTAMRFWNSMLDEEFPETCPGCHSTIGHADGDCPNEEN